jgi:HEPN domain-containing protein
MCIPAGPALPGVVAFHCQQAVEKLLKGFLTLADKRGGKTHSLARLGTVAAASFPEITDLVAAARAWSNWAFEFRYPDERGGRKPPPDEAELRRAIEVIDALAAQLRAANPEPPG